MKTLASALAGFVGVCVLATTGAAAAPYDPFGSSDADDYYAGQSSRGGWTAGDAYGQSGPAYGLGVQAAPQAQVAPIPREIVRFTANYAPGTIVVSTGERRPVPCDAGW